MADRYHTHHLTPFSQGGPTAEANGTLLCGQHHRHVHAQGWVGRLIDGHVHWRPPDPHAEEQSNAHVQDFERALSRLALRWINRNPIPERADTS